eukprot:2164223-Amphidinium_carterae.1
MDSDEFANMFSNAAGSQRPTATPKPAPGSKAPPPKMPAPPGTFTEQKIPTPKMPPQQGETFTAPKYKGPPPGAPGGPKAPPPK